MTSPHAPAAAAAAHPALHSEALDALHALTGRDDSVFHEGQFEAIAALVAEHQRALVVQRTGWGKSAVYFLSALLQRRRGAGPALIVSPLIALMRDQVAAAGRAGVQAEAISSANPTEWARIEQGLAEDSIDVLLVSPERLVNPRFREEQLPRLIARCGLLVIDEAHCISDWGHDFRPDYRRLKDLIAQMDPAVPVLATTATANSRVVADVAEQLAGSSAGEVLTIRGGLTRDSLRLGSLRLPSDRDRLAYLVEHLDSFPGSGIIYTLTVSAAEDIAQLLSTPQRPVRAYTGRTDAEQRAALEADLKDNRVKALVATSALGMGFDKPDLGFVIHVGAPSSPVAYYQQVGRAGRGTDQADVLLLPGEQDRAIWEYFATASMPSKESAGQVLAALSAAGSPLSTPALEARVDVKRSALEMLLKVLAVDGAVQGVPGGWISTGEPWVYDAERYEKVARARRAEQEAMITYEALSGDPSQDPAQCRMVFLARQLDDATAVPCTRCDVCLRAAGQSPWYPQPGEEGAAAAQVSALLDRVGVPVEPRGQWPMGLEQVGVRDESGRAPAGRIPAAERSEEGRVLARLSDLGWGGQLRGLLTTDADGRKVDAPVPQALGGAIVEVLKAWDWSQRPAGVVAIPSTTRPQLVSSLAHGIATIGRLEDLGQLDLAPHAEPLRATGSSAYRVRDVWDRFSVGPELAARIEALAGAPILLVDDEIASRWTMTIAARLLRRAGSGPVLPLALAFAG
ncbi:DEAD/DEAH box helicase [Brachybacterium sp. JHP9]|uniref:DNA 3'-5' helicase n=1 Tax=Brachybacterium equifaecis TaxID=2910770 RepID=A0ABT0R494_9MICO|nr:DEAD/DEAH box helicase [Brachybacterium equifaecis]MCL6423745.1 DEAD/DEAH box helicase [Brachybacterium equifaecis]